MRSEQRFISSNVLVMRRENCWIDHQLVRAKLKVTVPALPKGKRRFRCLLQSVNLKPVLKEIYLRVGAAFSG